MFSAPLSNTIDKLLLATGDSDMKWKIGRESEMEERICKSFTGLLFLRACMSLRTTDWRWDWGSFSMTPHGSSKWVREDPLGIQGSHLTVQSVPMDWNPLFFWYHSSWGITHHQCSSSPKLDLTQPFPQITWAIFSTVVLTFLKPRIQIQLIHFTKCYLFFLIFWLCSQ